MPPGAMGAGPPRVPPPLVAGQQPPGVGPGGPVDQQALLAALAAQQGPPGLPTPAGLPGPGAPPPSPFAGNGSSPMGAPGSAFGNPNSLLGPKMRIGRQGYGY